MTENIDVYRCGADEETAERFFMSTEPLNQQSEDYAFTLQVEDTLVRSANKIRFS